MKTLDRTGDTVRGFEVHVLGAWRGKRFAFHLPCSGHPLLTGEDALQAMSCYARRGYQVLAFTNSRFSGEETLTLEDMEGLYAH